MQTEGNDYTGLRTMEYLNKKKTGRFLLLHFLVTAHHAALQAIGEFIATVTWLQSSASGEKAVCAGRHGSIY